MGLRIEHMAPKAFLAFGTTWWAGHDVNKQWIAPFEIEFYFNAVGDLKFARTIVRFGLADDHGNIKHSSCSLHPRARNNGRPLGNSIWAMAIELTPPEST